MNDTRPDQIVEAAEPPNDADYRSLNDDLIAAEKRAAKAEARVREVEAERDRLAAAGGFAVERIQRAEATVARQAEVLREILEHPLISEQPDNNCDWHCVAEIQNSIRAVLASPEAAATEPRASRVVCHGVGRQGRKCLLVRGHSGDHDDGSGDRDCAWPRDQAGFTACGCMVKGGVIVALDRDCVTHRLGARAAALPAVDAATPETT